MNKTDWRQDFLDTGTANICGDLSIMIPVVSKIIDEQLSQFAETLVKQEEWPKEKPRLPAKADDGEWLENDGFNSAVSQAEKALEKVKKLYGLN